MVLEEVTRNQTPTSQKLAHWAKVHALSVLPTRIFMHFKQMQGESLTALRRANRGELAIQEVMNDLALERPPKTGVFLFDDHKIARASFLLPENCRKVSTRAFLIYLEQRGWRASAADVERRAIRAGRNFSQLRFPPG